MPERREAQKSGIQPEQGAAAAQHFACQTRRCLIFGHCILNKAVDGGAGVAQLLAMRVQDVIRGDKHNLSVGDWGSGKIQRTKFPLSKAGKRAWSFGAAWEWRFAEFEFSGRQFVLRLLLCEDKQKAHIHLGLRNGRDTTVLCCYEYHADHVTGWHLHTLCGEKNDIDAAPVGTVVHGPWVKRLPNARSRHNRTAFRADMHGGLKAWLWGETMRFFRLGTKDLLS